MRDRLKFSMEYVKNLIADEIPEALLKDPSKTILDPAIAGGQIISLVEKRMTALGIADIEKRVRGYEEDSIAVEYAVNVNKLKGTFEVSTYDEHDYKANIIVGNPAYNDGSAAKNTVYDTMLERIAEAKPDFVCMSIQANWFAQPDRKLGKDIRKFLKQLGVYKIVINPDNTFTTRVMTCTVCCRKGYNGDVELVDANTNGSRMISNFDERIFKTVDPEELKLLNALKPKDPWVSLPGHKDETKWRICTSYKKENFDVKPLNVFKVIEPKFKSQGGYRIFKTCKSQAQAEVEVQWYQSFWHSKLVTWILKRTRTHTTLDGPQIAWVPKITIDRVFTDEDLYKHFNLTKQQIYMIENSQ